MLVFHEKSKKFPFFPCVLVFPRQNMEKLIADARGRWPDTGFQSHLELVEASPESNALAHDHQSPILLYLPFVDNMQLFSQSSHHIPCFLAEGTQKSLSSLHPPAFCNGALANPGGGDLWRAPPLSTNAQSGLFAPQNGRKT